MPTTKVMFKSLITLYYTDEIIRERNLLIEDIDDYLENIEHKFNLTDYQAIKYENEVDLKLDTSNSLLNYSWDHIDSHYDYAKVVIQRFTRTFNDDKTTTDSTATTDNTLFYFVDSFKILANKTLQLHMVIDSVNSAFYEKSIEQIEACFDKRTLIHRQHEDNYFNDTTIYFEESDPESTQATIKRNIDEISEGLNVPLQSERHYEVSDVDDNTWYLLYYGDNSGVDTYLLPEKSTDVITYGLSTANETKITIQDDDGSRLLFVGGKIHLEITDTYNITMSYDYTIGEQITIGSGDNATTIKLDAVSFGCMTGNHTIQKLYVHGIDISSGQRTYLIINDYSTHFDHIVATTYNTAHIYWAMNLDTKSAGQFTNELYSFIYDLEPTTDINILTNAPETTISLYDYSTLNLVDQKNLKIIQLPYKPTSDFNGWTFDNTKHFMKLTSSRIAISNTLDIESVGSDLFSLITKANIKTNITRPTSEWDSKMYHSDFNMIKLYYDSFSTMFKYEELDPYDITQDYRFNKLEFNCSKVFNSHFLFHVKDYYPYKAKEDYSGYIVVNRNNEMPIYNSDYVNYVKTGYNYDKKQRALDISTAAIKTGTNTAFGAIGGAIAGAKASGIGAVPGAILGGAIALVSGTIDTIKTSISEQQSIEQKLATLQAQGTTVSVCDDVDLMDIYCNNKVHVRYYRPNQTIKENLNNLFIYFGYKKEVYGVPNIHNKMNWNFLQCDPIFTQGSIKFNLKNILSEKLKDGITIIHKTPLTDGTYIWDINQNYINWDTWLYTQARG